MGARRSSAAGTRSCWPRTAATPNCGPSASAPADGTSPPLPRGAAPNPVPPRRPNARTSHLCRKPRARGAPAHRPMVGRRLPSDTEEIPCPATTKNSPGSSRGRPSGHGAGLRSRQVDAVEPGATLGQWQGHAPRFDAHPASTRWRQARRGSPPRGPGRPAGTSPPTTRRTAPRSVHRDSRQSRSSRDRTQRDRRRASEFPAAVGTHQLECGTAAAPDTPAAAGFPHPHILG